MLEPKIHPIVMNPPIAAGDVAQGMVQEGTVFKYKAPDTIARTQLERDLKTAYVPTIATTEHAIVACLHAIQTVHAIVGKTQAGKPSTSSKEILDLDNETMVIYALILVNQYVALEAQHRDMLVWTSSPAGTHKLGARLDIDQFNASSLAKATRDEHQENGAPVYATSMPRVLGDVVPLINALVTIYYCLDLARKAKAKLSDLHATSYGPGGTLKLRALPNALHVARARRLGKLTRDQAHLDKGWMDQEQGAVFAIGVFSADRPPPPGAPYVLKFDDANDEDGPPSFPGDLELFWAPLLPPLFPNVAAAAGEEEPEVFMPTDLGFYWSA